MNPPPHGELAELARRAMAGDAQAFRAWVERTTPVAWRVAVRQVGNPQDAEEVVQEAFVQAWKSMERLRDPAASLGWLCGIVRHVGTDLVRGKARAARRSGGSLDDPNRQGEVQAMDPAADERMEQGDRVRLVRGALDALGDKHREVIMLRDVDGLSYEEVSQVLGVPAGTVESRLHRARVELGRRLRVLLRKAEGMAS